MKWTSCKFVCSTFGTFCFKDRDQHKKEAGANATSAYFVADAFLTFLNSMIYEMAQTHKKTDKTETSKINWNHAKFYSREVQLIHDILTSHYIFFVKVSRSIIDLNWFIIGFVYKQNKSSIFPTFVSGRNEFSSKTSLNGKNKDSRKFSISSNHRKYSTQDDRDSTYWKISTDRLNVATR